MSRWWGSRKQLNISAYLTAAARELPAPDKLVAARFADAAIARAEAGEEEPEVKVTAEDSEAMDSFIGSLLAPHSPHKAA